MSYQIESLHLSYEYIPSSATVEKYVDDITSIRQNILLETIESFGSYIGNPTRPLVPISYYTTPNDVDLQLPKNGVKEDISYGMFRFTNAMMSFGGSIAAWENAVKEVGAWYVANVKGYSQVSFIMCSLTGLPSRCDCSGFVTTCLQRYGLMKNIKFQPSSEAYCNDGELAKTLTDGGFEKLNFSWDVLQPFDIMVFNTGKKGHIEIYNGVVDGKHTSWGWGQYHPSLPCRTAYQGRGYDYIWRCKGGGITLLSKMINMIGTVSPGQSGLSDFMFKYLYKIESGVDFGKPLPARLLNGVDLGDAGGHKTYGAGLLFHPDGKYMDSIKKSWTQKELDSLFVQTVKKTVNNVDSWATRNGIKLNQNQKDSIVSGIYNFGAGFLNKQVCKLIANNPNDSRIYNIWVHMSDVQGKKYSGLITRRKMEADHYFGRS